MADEGCQVIAAVYARLSKQDTRTAGDNGTARQLELGRAFVVKNGWTVNESYVLADDGVSGANFDHSTSWWWPRSTASAASRWPPRAC